MSYTATYQDIRKWYQGCFAIIGNKLSLINDVVNATRSNGVIQYEFIYKSTDKDRAIDKFIPLEEVNFLHPKLGAINYKDFVIFFSRNHKIDSSFRHRKGTSMALLNLFFPNRSELIAINQSFKYSQLSLLNYISFGDKAMLDFLSPLFIPEEYPTAEQALKEVVSSESISRAFSRQLYFSIDNSTNGVVLYRNTQVIGKLNKIKGIFIVPNPLFNKELDSYGVKYANE